MNCTSTFRLVIVFGLSLVLVACAAPAAAPAPAAEEAETYVVEGPPYGPLDCITFEDQLLGTRYTVGNSFAATGARITVLPFDGYMDGHAEIQGDGNAGGSGQDIWIQNVNLAFDFGGPLGGLTLRFGAYGGSQNIAINGVSKSFVDFADINGILLGEVEISAEQDGSGQGQIELSGEIYSFAIGGQEFAIDDVCPRPVEIPVECIGFEKAALGNQYRVGAVFGEAGATITVLPFDGYMDGHAEIQGDGNAGGSGQDIWIQNVNLAFDFGGPLGGLTLRFGAYGGSQNIAINGVSKSFVDFADINGILLGEVEISAEQDGSGQGQIELSGEIYSFAIGGQEFAIDDVCPGGG